MSVYFDDAGALHSDGHLAVSEQLDGAVYWDGADELLDGQDGADDLALWLDGRDDSDDLAELLDGRDDLVC